MIQQNLIEELDNEIARKESLRARALVSEHLRKLSLNNLYVVDSLDEMLEISIKLYEAAKIVFPFEKYNPHNQV